MTSRKVFEALGQKVHGEENTILMGITELVKAKRENKSSLEIMREIEEQLGNRGNTQP